MFVFPGLEGYKMCRLLSGFILSFLLLSTPALAEEYYTFYGVVYSGFKYVSATSSIPNPGVVITAEFPDAGKIYSTVSDENGLYELPIPMSEVVAVEEQPEPGFLLNQNYPNPFNPSTTITFEIPDEEHVSLEIFNISGQKIRTLIDDHRSVGMHTVTWDGSDENSLGVSAGVYLYRIRAGAFMETRKMTLLDGEVGTSSQMGAVMSAKASNSAENRCSVILSASKDGYVTQYWHLNTITLVPQRIPAMFTPMQLDHFPLAVGNSWTFESDGEEYTYTVTEKRTINDKEYFVFDTPPKFFEQRPNPHPYPAEAMFRKDLAGNVFLWDGSTDVLVYFFSFTTASDKKMIDRIGEPAVDLSHYYYIPDEISTLIYSVDDTVSFDDHSFYPCYRFYVWLTGSQDTSVNYWFAPGIGPVKIQWPSGYTQPFILKRAIIDGEEIFNKE